MKISLALLFYLISFFAFSQVDLISRLELQPRYDNFEYQIITAQDHGFLLYSLKEEVEDDIDPEEMKNLPKKRREEEEEPTEKIWEFIKYNDKFQEEKRIEFTISVNLYYSTVFQDEHKIYFFYQNPSGEDRNDFLVLTIDLQTLVYSTFEGHLPAATSITRFFVTEDRVFVGGWANKKPIMTLIDLKNAGVDNIELPKEFSIHSFSKASNDNVFIVLKSAYDKKKLEIEYRLWEYSKHGYKKSETLLFSKEEGFFIDNIHIVHQKEKGKFLVFGAYLSHKKHQLKGAYSLIINDQTKKREKYNQYDFYDFKHFFDPLRIAERNHRLPFLAKESTKRDKLNYLFTFQNLVENDKGYLLIGEVFFPHFSKDKGHFKGNLYTHAVLMFFDKDGKLVWDNLFEMDIQTPIKVQNTFLRTNFTSEQLDVISYDDGVFRGGYFNQDGIKMMEYQHILNTGKKYENILINWEQNLIHWYDDYYLLSGKQRIFDKQKQQERSVFFIDCVKKQ